jgi:hypothetical protein
MWPLVCLLLALLSAPLSSAVSPSLQRLRSSPPLRPSSPVAAPAEVHTWHNVSVPLSKSAWTGVLSVLNEDLSFVDRLAGSISSFPITSTQPFEFGTVLHASDDFNVLYQLTMVEQVTSSAVTAKVCLFVIGAHGAANPQIANYSFSGGAQCSWNINQGVGEVIHTQTPRNAIRTHTALLHPPHRHALCLRLISMAVVTQNYWAQ